MVLVSNLAESFMAPKRKLEVDSQVANLKPEKLEVSLAVRAILELGGLLEFLEKFKGSQEDIS